MTKRPFDWGAFGRGVKASLCTGGVVLSGSFIGYGALVKASGLGVSEGLFITIVVWALPGQVVLVSTLAAGAGIAGAAAAVTLTAVRLMPMVVAIMPEMRFKGHPRWLYFLVAHFTAATVWLEARRVFPSMDQSERLPYMVGLGSAFMTTMCVMTVVGYQLAGFLPVVLAACLIFLTPCYFLLGLLASAQDRLDIVSMVLGGGLFAILHHVLPQFDMLIAGLAGGTVAFMVMRLSRRRKDDE